MTRKKSISVEEREVLLRRLQSLVQQTSDHLAKAAEQISDASGGRVKAGPVLFDILVGVVGASALYATACDFERAQDFVNDLHRTVTEGMTKSAAFAAAAEHAAEGGDEPSIH